MLYFRDLPYGIVCACGLRNKSVTETFALRSAAGWHRGLRRAARARGPAPLESHVEHPRDECACQDDPELDPTGGGRERELDLAEIDGMEHRADYTRTAAPLQRAHPLWNARM